MANYLSNLQKTSHHLFDRKFLSIQRYVSKNMVYTDADGYVYMLGRADDIINVGEMAARIPRVQQKT